MIKIEKILFPTDFSEHSKHAFSYALSFAKEYGAALHMLHVVEDIQYLANAYMFDVPMMPSFADMEQNRLVTREFPAKFIGDTFANLSRHFMEDERSILIGLLENTGNIFQRKKEALRMAQKTPDLSRLVANLQEVKKLQGNHPVFNPGPDYEIKQYSRAILIQT